MKKMAVVVRERQSEALRMGIGLTILNDMVDVYVLDSGLQDSEEVRFSREIMREMGMKVWTNAGAEDGIEVLSVDEIAQRLLQYDHVLPY